MSADIAENFQSKTLNWATSFIVRQTASSWNWPHVQKSLKQFIEKPDKKKKIDEQKAKRIREEQQEKTRRREEKDARKKAA